MPMGRGQWFSSASQDNQRQVDNDLPASKAVMVTDGEKDAGQGHIAKAGIQGTKISKIQC
jgi:hypothetical protein